MKRNTKLGLFIVPLLFSCTALVSSVKAGELDNLANAALNKTQTMVGAAIGDDMPDWAKRIEFDIKFNEDIEPTGSILTVQPLYQDKEKHHTFFTQLSYLNYEQFDDRKSTTNVGLGYRYVTKDNSVLLGGNVFYDREWDEGHERIGLGAEAKMAMFDLTANYYDAISNNEDISGGDTERALDGYDFELRSQVPYMPWARAGLGYYYWDSVDFDNVKGLRASLDMDVSPNLGLEVGLINDYDTRQDTQVFANLTFSFGNNGTSRALSNNVGTMITHGIDDKPFVKRDMRDQTLTEIRRQNKIITERNSSGVTISRAN